MAFNVGLVAGGELEKVKEVTYVAEVGKVNLPEHIFPKYSEPGFKGFEIDVPPRVGVFEIEYIPQTEIELTDVSFAGSGYGKGDYWEMIVGEKKLFETIYSKELPQHVNVGTAIFTVYRIPAGTPIKLQFNNESASTKTVWFDIRFLQP